MVFDAVLSKTSTDPTNPSDPDPDAGPLKAILYWDPALNTTRVLVRVGDTLTLDDGSTARITNLGSLNSATADAGGARADADVLKDGLNELGQLAFAADYVIDAAGTGGGSGGGASGGGGSTGSGIFVVSTSSAPEPGSAGLLLLGFSTALLRRRRRRRSGGGGGGGGGASIACNVTL